MKGLGRIANVPSVAGCGTVGQQSDQIFVSEDLQATWEICRIALGTPEMRDVQNRLNGVDPWAELLRVSAEPASVTRLKQLMKSYGAGPIESARWLLMRASIAALPKVASWPVFHSVRRLWCEEVQYFARPTGDLSFFMPDHVRFSEMARIATLRRYPAGQYHWEITGLPISWILRTPGRCSGQMLRILLQMGGRYPMVDTHINDRRKNRPLLTEAEGIRSYYRMARSIELQPEIRGLLTCSWLYCTATAEVTPHLAWLRRFFVDRGALIVDLGPAPEDSGFKVGSALRRKLYEEGRYRPQRTYVLWPRRDMIDWSRSVALEKTDPRI